MLSSGTVAVGTFEVELTSQPPEVGPLADVGRQTFTKQFAGDLVGTSAGHMLACVTPVEGSAAYVALELVSGSVCGVAGSFAVQHSATMNRGESSMSLTVIPDSGTEGLAGLSGTMHIDIIEGRHHYRLAVD